MMTIKKKLFFKEFMENKKFIVFFFVILTISFFISGFEYINFSSSLNSGYKPDVCISGMISDNVFEYYQSVDEAEKYISENCGNDITVVRSVVRQLASCTEHNSLNSVTYTIRGYSLNYIENYISSSIANGRSPEAGKNEVIVGSGFAKTMGIGIGDKINGQFVEMGTIGEIRLFVSLDSFPAPDDFQEYTITGILTDTCTYLENSAISVINDDMEPNALELIFDNKNATETYGKLLENMPTGSIGEVNELYAQKKNETISLVVDIISVTGFIIIIMYLIISLIIKGINKKLSVMKLIGVESGYIVSSFLEGFTIIMLAAIATAMILLVIAVIIMNYRYSEFVGADIIKFKMDIKTFLFLICVGVCIELNLLVILKHKIKKVGAKTAF